MTTSCNVSRLFARTSHHPSTYLGPWPACRVQPWSRSTSSLPPLARPHRSCCVCQHFFRRNSGSVRACPYGEESESWKPCSLSQAAVCCRGDEWGETKQKADRLVCMPRHSTKSVHKLVRGCEPREAARRVQVQVHGRLVHARINRWPRLTIHRKKRRGEDAFLFAWLYSLCTSKPPASSSLRRMRPEARCLFPQEHPAALRCSADATLCGRCWLPMQQVDVPTMNLYTASHLSSQAISAHRPSPKP